MDELVQWLGEQLDEDERIARAVGEESWRPRYVDSVSDVPDTAAVSLPDGTDVAVMERYSYQDAAHIAEWDPARVLREIDSKRKILDECSYWYDKVNASATEKYPQPDLGGRFEVAMPILLLLALPYSDRPGYREEWRP